MSRAKKNALVLDGNEIKLRLQAERAQTKSAVHVDWVRFTVQRRNSPTAKVEYLFPEARTNSIWDGLTRAQQLSRAIAMVPDCDSDAATQAFELAEEVAQALGPDFKVSTEVKKGQDYYKFRWSITRNDHECAWVGFLASSESPKQQAQARTLHANVTGTACTFADHGWTDRLAAIMESRDADVTRVDYALDFFDGIPGGLDSIVEQYKAGLCDVGGRRLKSSTVGDWLNNNSRSLYFGSKQAGKQTNCYEKGDQLYGPKAGNKWLRVELRYGNKLRVLSPEMLRRPADFFAGASDWHQSMLVLADQIATPEPIKCNGRLPLETVDAEVSRVVRWAKETAGPTIAALWQNLGDEFLEFVHAARRPGRLQKFSPQEVLTAFGRVMQTTAGGDGAPFAKAA